MSGKKALVDLDTIRGLAIRRRWREAVVIAPGTPYEVLVVVSTPPIGGSVELRFLADRDLVKIHRLEYWNDVNNRGSNGNAEEDARPVGEVAGQEVGTAGSVERREAEDDRTGENREGSDPG